MQYGYTRGALIFASVMVILLGLVAVFEPSQARAMMPTITTTSVTSNAVTTAVTPRTTPTLQAAPSAARVALYRANRSHQPLWWAKLWVKYPYAVYKFATCVAHHESWHAGLWKAKNGSSSASGFAQWTRSTWRTHLKRAGLKGYSAARYAPPIIQVRVFAAQVMKYGKYPWKGTHCAPGL